MSDSKRWRGGEREIKPRVEEDFLDPDDPNYIPTPAEYEVMKKNKEEAEKDAEKEKVSNA